MCACAHSLRSGRANSHAARERERETERESKREREEGGREGGRERGGVNVTYVYINELYFIYLPVDMYS